MRAFVQREIKPNVGRWFENAELPTEIFSKLASEGLFAMHLKGYGCAGLSAPQCDISLDDVAVGADALLPNNPGLRGPFMCLNVARLGIGFGALGAARDSLEEALTYATERSQSDQPIASYQLTQEKLANMELELNKGQLLPFSSHVALLCVCWSAALLAAQGMQMGVNLSVLTSPGGNSLISTVQAFRFIGVALYPLIFVPVCDAHPLGAFVICCAALSLIILMQVKVKP
mgnify:FL=1